MTQTEIKAYDALMADRDSWKERFLRLAKEKALGPSDAAACSASSTPETNEAWDRISRTADGWYDSRIPISAYAYAMSDHSKKMERERDEARREAERLHRTHYGAQATGCPWEIRSRQSPENANVDARQ